MCSSIPLAARSSLGVHSTWGPPKFTPNDDFPTIGSKACRTILFSSSGEYFAYIDGQTIHILSSGSWKPLAVLEGVKAYYLAFSPKGTYLCSWEPFVVNKTNPQGSPNLHVYKSETGELIKSFVQKKQTNWEPVWSCDEVLFSRIVNTDVIFYENHNFEKIVHRINGHKVANYSISPTSDTYFVVNYEQGSKGQPSLGRLFKYPKFENNQSLANKSFFQSDKVEFYWNSKGTHLLVLTMTEVDKTGSSYYGRQGLHFIGTNGETALVILSKEGPIHNVSWAPSNSEFCVVYGFMPSRTTIFNLKCESIFEFGAGPRNSIYYNPHGNILLLGGFGNLQGNVELWDVSKKKLIGTCDAPDSTLIEWSPDGTYFLTATTAPRLRTGNGYKIWHYSGTLVFEKPCSNELYEVYWQKYPKNTFKEPAISTEKVEGIVSSQPQASKQAYRPPSARNRPAVRFKLHDDDETVHPPASDTTPSHTPSKVALKQKKKRENRKARKQEEGNNPGSPTEVPVTSNVEINLTGDPEKDKKLKNIKKKLDAIAKLKEQQAQGKTLEVNQIAKVKGEDDLLKELQQLQL